MYTMKFFLFENEQVPIIVPAFFLSPMSNFCHNVTLR